MNSLNELRAILSRYTGSNSEFNAKTFIDIESVLCILRKVSPEFYPSKAYVLLRGYQIMNHSKKDWQLYILQQARRKLFLYSSKMRWEEDFKKYLDEQFADIRLYNVEDDRLVVNSRAFYQENRENLYIKDIETYNTKMPSIPYAKAGIYKFYKNNKELVTVEIPEWVTHYVKCKHRGHVIYKAQRDTIELTYNQLIETAMEMRNIVSDDYCYDVLSDNKLSSFRNGDEKLTINGMTNIVGMVGAGKSTLMKVLCFYLARNGFRTVVVLNSVSDVVKLYRYLKKFNITVSPLIGKSNQENYVSALLKPGELFIDEDISDYLTAPCMLNGFNSQESKAWEYSERPCYKLKSCNDEQPGKRKCPLFDICGGAAMLREATTSSVVITTVAGLAASYVGDNHSLFLEEVINSVDVVMFDECDRVQSTLDDFFAPNTAFNDFMIAQSDGCAMDMRKSYSEIAKDPNERYYFELARETAGIYNQIASDIENIANERGAWGKIVTATFSGLTLIEQLHKEGIDAKLERALRECLYLNETSFPKDDFSEQLSEIVDDSCRPHCHMDARLNRLFKSQSININIKDLNHIQFLLKVILFDRMMHWIDDAARTVDLEILHNNNISDFLQSRFIIQQKYLPSAPMGNMFGMMYSKSDEKLKVYRQYACGRYLMLSMPWLRVDSDGNPCGPHAVLMSGSSYAPGSLQYNVELPVDYVLESPKKAKEYLDKSKFIDCASTVVVSGSKKSDRDKKIKELLYEIRRHIEIELLRPGKILFVVNSYEEAKSTWKATNALLSGIHSAEKSAVLIRDDENICDGMVKKNQIEYFGYRPEKILVAPASVICRGYNIVDDVGNAAIRSVFFLVRPMQVPDDISLKVGKLNGYISKTFNHVIVSDWGIYADNVKNEAGKFWGQLEKDSGVSGLNYLSPESKKDIIATVFVMLDQIFGRTARVRELTTIGDPPRIYFADAAFRGGTGGNSFSIIDGILSYIDELMERDGNVAKKLYGAFYNALKENKHEQEEPSDDGIYSESYND